MDRTELAIWITILSIVLAPAWGILANLITPILLQCRWGIRQIVASLRELLRPGGVLNFRRAEIDLRAHWGSAGQQSR